MEWLENYLLSILQSHPLPWYTVRSEKNGGWGIVTLSGGFVTYALDAETSEEVMRLACALATPLHQDVL